jgi:hypothetical protein
VSLIKSLHGVTYFAEAFVFLRKGDQKMNSWIQRFMSAVVVVLLAGLLNGCGTLPEVPQSSRAKYDGREVEYLKLETFDIGVGFAVAKNVRHGPNNDASGTLVSLKGYPFGKWYASPKKLDNNVGDIKLDPNSHYQVPGKGPLSRLSVFYGASAGEFSGGGLNSTLHAVGVGFDITPGIALLGGWSFYDVTEQDGTSDTDDGFIFGVSLNMSAFKRLLASIADVLAE